MNVIELNRRQIGYHPRHIVLRDVSLNIRPGEKMAILGQSGGGKTALLKHLFTDINNSGIKNPTAFYLQQDLGLVSPLSVLHNVYIGRLDAFPTWYNLLNLALPQSKIRQLIQPILCQLGLQDKENTPVKRLSGGQQQRVIIARALFSEANILLADEPTTGLDEQQSADVMRLLLNAFSTAVVVLHNIDLALQHFDRVIGLKEGQVYLNERCDRLSPEQLVCLYR